MALRNDFDKADAFLHLPPKIDQPAVSQSYDGTLCRGFEDDVMEELTPAVVPENLQRRTDLPSAGCPKMVTDPRRPEARSADPRDWRVGGGGGGDLT